MTRDEKLELHKQVTELEKAITSMNGPYAQTSNILSRLGALRDTCIDDAVFSGCEFCGETIFESELENAYSSDDGWACADCVNLWNKEQETA